MATPTIRVREGVLQRLREIHRLPSEEAVARLIGVNRSTLRRIEAGDAPSAAFMAGAAQAFGLSIDTLFEVVTDDAPGLTAPELAVSA